MRVLIVKVSSLGDIIHTLPAVTDACLAKKDLRFDWVVEEAFTDIPSWHPGVDKVIPVAFRRWRKNLSSTWKSGEFSNFKKNLQEEHYDLIIDAQGLIKSAIISRIARGLTVGLNNHTIKEPLATLFYNVRYTVPWQQHAVERVRDLFSRTFNYSLDYKPCDYGLDIQRFLPEQPSQENTLVFFHGTTWDTKKWPDKNWQLLAKIAGREGYKVKVLWGNNEELERAKLIAQDTDNVEVLDKLSLTEIARVLVQAKAVVAVDTGLAHLAAALNVPVVSIYGATNSDLTGTYGLSQVRLTSTLPCSPCLRTTCSYEGDEGTDVWPACYSENPPDLVWNKVRALIADGEGDLDKLIQRGW